MRILLVEDDSRVAHPIAKGLREQAYAVDLAPDGEAAVYVPRWAAVIAGLLEA